MQVPACLTAIAIALMHSDVKTEKLVVRDVQLLERATLSYIKSLGTQQERAARAKMSRTRAVVISHGRRAIGPLSTMLKRKQVNVRRGAAITLNLIVGKHGIDDEKLLETVLLRMVEDTDIKCRSNMYHVVKAIVANIKKRL